MQSKECSGCKKIKDLTEFAVDKSRKDGLKYCCRECCKDQFRKWRESNQEEDRAKSREWYQDNLDRALSTTKQWREDNPEKNAATARSWRLGHPERIAAYNAQRQRRLSSAILTPEDIERTIEFRLKHIDDPCYYCGKYSERMAWEHLLPLSRGGADVWWNIERACKSCNSRKGTKDHLEFQGL